MVALDDRTGNVLTTIAVFVAAGCIAYAARAAIVVFVLALLLAYVLEPVVDRVQRHWPWASSGRAGAIAVVYILGAALAGAIGFTLAPAFAGHLQPFGSTTPETLARFTNRQFLAEHSTQITGIVERTARVLAASLQNAGWLLMVPVVAAFVLNDRASLLDGTIDLFARRRDRAGTARTVQRIDAMLAQYARAQLTLAGMSVAVYSVAAALLGFPYAFALGVLGGLLEFLPAVGWILAASLILVTGYLAHAHWIWMAGLIVAWRIVLNIVVSPRVMGDRLEMKPATVMVALLAGGQIGGIVGVLLAVPAVAIFRILFSERDSRRETSAA